MNSIYVLATRFIFFCIVFVFCTCENGEKLPNVIIIFTDDQGYGDLGCYGAEGFETPNIDSMAKEGNVIYRFLRLPSSMQCIASIVNDWKLCRTCWNSGRS